jgi:hypothetical protein
VATRRLAMMKLTCSFSILVMMLCTTVSQVAVTTPYTGNLDPNNPNSVFTMSFVLHNPAPVTIRTYGYSGTASAPNGRNAAGMVTQS